MKIALIGYGKMGKLIHSLAEERGHAIVSVFNSKKKLSDLKEFSSLAHADVCIDFSLPHSVLENVQILCSLNKNIVMGTTGWNKNFEEIQKLVDNSHIGFIHAPNFSLGIALFLSLIEKTASLMAPFKQYEAAGIEIHHRQKIDSPSGTAKAIEKKFHGYAPANPFSFSSVRVGSVPGTHSVVFDSPVDTITLTHTARNREGFAQGALTAAEWLQGKTGMFTLDHLIDEQIK